MLKIFSKFGHKKPVQAEQPQVSYSQCGEDLIVHFLLNWMQLPTIRYLDLGANDPVKFNNTYLLYTLGHRGVLVEADQDLAKKIRDIRPEDTCVAKAVTVTSDKQVEFYKMSADTLSTTQSETAERYERETEHQLSLKMTIEACHINTLLEEHFGQKAPDFVSLDVEGLDLALIRAWNFERWRPAVFCIETLTYTQNQTAIKIREIFETMEKAGYQVYADTYINTIFLDRSVKEI